MTQQKMHGGSLIDAARRKQPKVPVHMTLAIPIGLLILYTIGYIREFLRYIGLETNNESQEIDRRGYPELYKSFEKFYGRNFFRRIRDGWNTPIASVPGAIVDVIDRYSDDENVTFKLKETRTRAINMASYNYLGTAENSGHRLEAVISDIERFGASTMSCRAEYGTTPTLLELEQKVARYLNVEDAIVFGMGFATNSHNIPPLAGGEGTLILSDKLNHASQIVGCKISGATCKVFEHNDTVDLERKLRDAIIKGQPTNDGSFKSWRKAIIIVEGIFSMEGTIVNLPEVIRIKKKYKAYLYLDEAHSIGALGKSVVFYFNCDPNDVDVLMGTFTKSFGAAGGYIAGKKSLVNYLRLKSHATYYGTSMAPPVARQIIGVLDSINGDEDPTKNEGLQRIAKLMENTHYFRKELKKRGFIVLGNDDSPVVPLLVYSATIVVEIIRAALKRGVAIVGAGFPATPITEARIRFCLSSSHTKQMLDEVIDVIDDIGSRLHVKFGINN